MRAPRPAQIVTRPYPMLVEDAADDAGRARPWRLLVAPGKHGAEVALVRGLDGVRVTLEGTRSSAPACGCWNYGPVRLLVRVRRRRQGRARSIRRQSDGHASRWEIVDSKCFLGVMTPGAGRTHSACASLCLRGGIPPALLSCARSGRAFGPVSARGLERRRADLRSRGRGRRACRAAWRYRAARTLAGSADRPVHVDANRRGAVTALGGLPGDVRRRLITTASACLARCSRSFSAFSEIPTRSAASRVESPSMSRIRSAARWRLGQLGDGGAHERACLLLFGVRGSPSPSTKRQSRRGVRPRRRPAASARSAVPDDAGGVRMRISAAFTTMRWSQVESCAWPSKRWMARKADRKASCTASRAASSSPEEAPRDGEHPPAERPSPPLRTHPNPRP